MRGSRVGGTEWIGWVWGGERVDYVVVEYTQPGIEEGATSLVEGAGERDLGGSVGC